MDVVTNKLKKDPVECRSDHLSSFTMVMLKAEVYGNSNKNIKKLSAKIVIGIAQKWPNLALAVSSK